MLGAVQGASGVANSVKAVFGGGNADSGSQNVLQTVTIATAGDAVDFGNLTVVGYMSSGLSNGHGGLG